jgi:glycosyltransferase involved in cell wall biosynthesis
MRIALASWNRKKFGGAETYLDSVIPGLAWAGHDLAHLSEVALPDDRAEIRLPTGAAAWCRASQESDEILAQLADWEPDVIFSQRLRDPTLEEALLRIAPTVYYAHDNYGACISGSKTFAFPRVRPCGRSFDWRCLARYYPRRCGGLNPATMWRLYRHEMWHLDLLRRYDAIAVGSEYMREVLLRQGLDPDSVRMFPQPIAGEVLGLDPQEQRTLTRTKDQRSGDEWRLLFAGRMVELKGGEILLLALPQVKAALQRPIRLVMAGDGPARSRWEMMGRRLTASVPDIAVEFPGWLQDAQYWEAVTRSDLIVMPSLCPETVGRAGLEAGVAGVPAVAFAVGGIPEWLVDGKNGHLAPGDPPTTRGLADAIVRSLADPDHRADLGRRAHEATLRFSLKEHVEHLIELFEEARTRRFGPVQREDHPSVARCSIHPARQR